MYPPVPTRSPAAVEMEVQRAFMAMFPEANRFLVTRAFGWASECFTGQHGDYQAIDARYHDFEHTLQGTLCMTRLLWGRHETGAMPALTERGFQLGLLAILLHDTGYLKRRGDAAGTGAKYTATHVDRSANFAAQLLAEKGFSTGDVQAVRNMIHCTGVNLSLDRIAFQDGLEKVLGCALGTADLLGQMAADDYIEKLPTLYEEFAEAAAFSHDPSLFVASFSSAEELIRKTPAFWEGVVRPRLTNDYLGLYRFLNVPYPDGRNDYCERIQANLERVRQPRLAGAS